MKKLLLMMCAMLLVGCGEKQPEPIKVPQALEYEGKVQGPLLKAEEGSRAQVLKAALENNRKRASYIYDLEAERKMCFK